MGNLIGSYLTKNLSHIDLDCDDFHILQENEVLFFVDGSCDNPSRLRLLKFPSNVKDTYYQILSTIMDNKIDVCIKLWYDEETITIHCVEIDGRGYPSPNISPTSFGWQLIK